MSDHRTIAPGASHEEFWDERYETSERIWSGEPNTVLVRETTGLPPGRALDLGCGEGADAVWLAERGWQVTATDISRVALGRAARHAREAGVADRVDCQWHDLTVTFPTGGFDLVSAHFLHAPTQSFPRERILRPAAAAVVPGGTLLIVGHAGHHEPTDLRLPTTEEVLASLELPEGEWEVLLSEEHERHQTDRDGRQITRTDNALKVRRLPV